MQRRPSKPKRAGESSFAESYQFEEDRTSQSSLPPRPPSLGKRLPFSGTWQAETPDVIAKFINNLQQIAEGSRLGIPMTPSDNPRNGIRRSFMGVEMATESGNPNAPRTISQWPSQLGLAAIGDAAAVREYASIAAQEMRAMGLRVILGPQADVATEPRWNRISGTFGEDADFVAKLTTAFVEGFQGKKLGPETAP